MNTKTKNSSRHFHFSETLETSSNMGKRTGSLHFGQPEQPPPEGDPCSTGTCCRRGCGDAAGGGRAAGGTAGPRDTALGTAGLRRHGGCWQVRARPYSRPGRALLPRPPRHTPGPQELHILPALPTLSPGALKTLSCRKPFHAHFPVPKQTE